MKSELEKTAHHEAAHSVASYARGAWLGPVSIEPNEDGSLGHSRGEEHMPADDWSDEEIEDRIIDFYAGLAADVRLDPASEEKAYRQAEDDTESAERYLRLLPGNRKENEKRVRAKTAAFVDKHWEEISRLARTFLSTEHWTAMKP